MVQRRCKPVSPLLEIRLVFMNLCAEICFQTASLNLFQETVPPICFRSIDAVCFGRESLHVSLLDPSNPLWGNNWSFWFPHCSALGPGFAFIAAAALQLTHSFTVLAAFAKATHTNCRQKPELTPVNVPHRGCLL